MGRHLGLVYPEQRWWGGLRWRWECACGARRKWFRTEDEGAQDWHAHRSRALAFESEANSSRRVA